MSVQGTMDGGSCPCCGERTELTWAELTENVRASLLRLGREDVDPELFLRGLPHSGS